MPHIKRAAHNAYHREYQRKLYARRVTEMIAHLGGKCARCGSTSLLQIDHIDPKQKSFTLTINYKRKLADLLQEMKKCQLLCSPCHLAKTVIDRGHKPSAGTHGTLSSYRHCKCKECKAANAAYMREYKKRKPR